jgi:hypothetical protein
VAKTYINIKNFLDAANKKTQLVNVFPRSPFFGANPQIGYDTLISIAKQKLDRSEIDPDHSSVPLREQVATVQYPAGVNLSFAEAPSLEDVRTRKYQSDISDPPAGAFIPNPTSPGVSGDVINNLGDVNGKPYINVDPYKKKSTTVSDTIEDVFGPDFIDPALLVLDSNADSEPTVGTSSPIKRSKIVSATTIGESYQSGFNIYRK